MTLNECLTQLESGATTSLALVEACLATIDHKNSELNVFVRLYRDEALSAARASDARRATGKPLSPFDGVPVGIKDNMSYKNHITSAGSKLLETYEAPYDATVVAKLKAAGAVIVGALNMDEFAMGSSGENSAFGATKNPRDPSRVAGGSSSGSAAAVAAGMVPLTFGSDTGGSIRMPAAFCGVVGLKPTYGAVSRYGLLAMASSLDQIGPFGATVDDAAAGFHLIAGFDAHDSTSQAATFLPPKPHYRIGVPKQFLQEGLDPLIKQQLEQAITTLEERGHTIDRSVDIPLLEQSVAIYYVIMPAEVSSNLARYDGIRYGVHGASVVESRTQGFGDEVKRRLMLGTFALSAGYADQYYKRAQAARAALTKQLAEALRHVDVLLGPVSPELPFKIGAKSHDPLAMYLSDIYTIPVNLAGLPALSVPVGTAKTDNATLPIGLQLIGKPWSEPQLFDLGHHIERKDHA